MVKIAFRLVFVAAFMALLLIILGSAATAWTGFKGGHNATVAKGETVDSSLWIWASNINVAGTVNGDIFCGGRTVNISGIVKGDIYCAAQTINLSGSVGGSARLAAQTINFSGQIEHGASFAAQTVNTDSKSKIAMDASMAVSDLILNGTIGRDLAATAKNLNLSGQVIRDISANVGNIYLTSGATVGGGIDYTSKNTISKAGDAQVRGKITQHQPKQKSQSVFRVGVIGGVFAFILALMFLVMALVFTAILPQVVTAVTEQGLRRPWVALGIGFLASLLAPIAIILVAITVVGLPLAALIGLGWLMTCILSGIFSAFWVGRKVWPSQRHAMLVTLIGSIILLVLYLIPIIGIVALVLAAWFGEGMLLLQLKSLYKRPRYELKTAK